MSAPPSVSPIARRQASPKTLAFGFIGCILGLIPTALFVVFTLADPDATQTDMTLAITVPAFLFLLVPSVLLLIGMIASLRARRVNRNDWSRAEAIADAMNELLAQPHAVAYGDRAQWRPLSSSIILEAERHFDSEIGGKITGEIASRFSLRGSGFGLGLGQTQSTFFGGGVHGHSAADFDVDLTSRTNLLSDALFAVVETVDDQGRADTARIVTVSTSGTATYMRSLVNQAAQQLGGTSTHAGATLLGYRERLVDRFTPVESSYLTDQVKWAKHNGGIPLAVWGIEVGRNIVLAVAASVDDKEPLMVYPLLFPEMLGRAVSRGISASPPLFASSRERLRLEEEAVDRKIAEKVLTNGVE